eukprot:540898_1
MQTHIQNTLQKIQKRTTNRLQEIRKHIRQCVNQSIGKIQSLRLTINHPLPEFKDDNKILNIAVTRTTESLESYIKYTQKMTDERIYETGLINYSDQQYQFESDFVAAYIHKARQVLMEFTQRIGINEALRTEIYYLLCLAFAKDLCTVRIKYHNTKLLPIIRSKFLTKTTKLPTEMGELHPTLTVENFVYIAYHKELQKGMNYYYRCVRAEPFSVQLASFIEKQYKIQKSK